MYFSHPSPGAGQWSIQDSSPPPPNSHFPAKNCYPLTVNYSLIRVVLILYYYIATLLSNIYICLCLCVCLSCRRLDRVAPRWPYHAGRHPLAADARQPGVSQRPDLRHRHQQHQQHHTTGYTSPLPNSVLLSILLSMSSQPNVG